MTCSQHVTAAVEIANDDL